MTPLRFMTALSCLALLAAATPAERLAVAEKDAARSKARIEKLDRQAMTAADEAQRFDARAALLATRVQHAEAVLAATQARTALIDQALAKSRASLAERQGKLVNLLAALESLSRRPPALALVQPGSVHQTARVATLLEGLLPVVARRTADLRAELTMLQKLRSQSAASHQQIKQASSQLDDSRKQLEAMAGKRRKTASNIATASMLESDRALALSVQAQDLRQLMRETTAEAQLIGRLKTLPGPILRPLHIPASALPPPQDRLAAAAKPEYDMPSDKARMTFILPVLGEVKTGFGEISDAGIRSHGLTLETREKAQIVAPAAGRIAFAGPFRTYGNVAIIDHGNGMTTLLTGMEKLDIRTGQTIAAGGPVGRMGTAHRELSFEIRNKGEPVNPLPLVTGN